MGLFDNIGKAVNNMAKSVTDSAKTPKTVDVVFSSLPETYEEFIAMPQAALSTPYDTAAMTILAFCFFPQDKELCYKMIQYLKGPTDLSDYQRSFIKDRFMDQDYVPRSYFKGATPANDYLPSQPYTITISTNPHSFDNDGYVRVWIRSGGADSPRQIDLRKAKDGKWYLWEQYVLVGIRKPESQNPWA